MKKSSSATSLPVRLTSGPGHYFFGYYDKSPWDASGRWVLALRVPFMDRPPRAEDRVEVGVIDTGQGNQWLSVASSCAWNWQQGCMLQWLGNGREIIFNDRIGDQFVARVIDLDRGGERVIERPVYAVSPAGTHAASVNFSRLHHQRPGYGYAGIPDPWQKIAEPEDDGVYSVDLLTGKSRRVLSIAEAAAFERRADFEGKYHRFNHLQFNRNGSRLGFLHRYQSDGPHKTRLMAMNPEGGALRCISDHEMVSHYDWHPDGGIVAWARRRETGDGYYLFRNEGDRIEAITAPEFTDDGHCSFSPCGRLMLTDTYPDRDRQQSLFIYDLSSRAVMRVSSVRSMPLPAEIRCDLHPRWSRDGRSICFDSTHEGCRHIYSFTPDFLS